MNNWFLIAISSPLLSAISNHIDKYLVTKIGAEVGIRGIITFSGLFGSIIAVFILIFSHGAFEVETFSRFVLVVTGIINTLAVFYYLKALTVGEATIVAPFFQLVPVFAYIFGLIFFHEVFSSTQIIAGLITIVGAGIISFDFEAVGDLKNKFRKDVVLTMILSSLLFAVGVTTFKWSATEASFWASNFWQYIGIFLTGFIFLLIPKFRDDFLVIFKGNTFKIVGFISIIEALTILGNLATTFALVLAPIALVLLVGSFQPVFIFIIGILGTLFIKGFVQEKLSRVSIIQKVLAISLILVGAYILYM